MSDSEHCCICNARAEYTQRILCRGANGRDWQELPRVYADKPYCAWHFFTLAEHTQEWTAQQTAREAHRTGLDYIRDHQLQGEPYQPI